MFISTDVWGGTSGTSRDVPIFVQFHEKIRTVDEGFRKKKIKKKRKKRKI